MKITIKCQICGKEKITNSHKPAKYCSNICRGKNMSLNFKGEKNPNFGKKWSNKQRLSQSLLIKSKVTEEYRKECGTANRGKKFDQNRIDKMFKNRDPNWAKKEPFTKSHRENIGLASAKKFTLEYKADVRKVMEERGFWIPLEMKSDVEIYYNQSFWKAKMWDVVYSPLLPILGVFHPKKNPKGLVRDHMFSRYSGFIHKVPPILLRHPSNCQLITHSENVRKKNSKNIDSDSITLNQLLNNIILYTEEWYEQDSSLEAIENYNKGILWERDLCQLV